VLRNNPKLENGEKVEVLLIGGIQELQELLSIRVPLAIGLVFLDLQFDLRAYRLSRSKENKKAATTFLPVKTLLFSALFLSFPFSFFFRFVSLSVELERSSSVRWRFCLRLLLSALEGRGSGLEDRLWSLLLLRLLSSLVD